MDIFWFVQGRVYRNVIDGRAVNLMFTDDTCIVYVNENLNELIQHVNNKLAAISDW